MPDEIRIGEEADETEAPPPIVHDDIMQRLLDYQRQLREGISPEQAAEPAALVDYAALEAPAQVATQIEPVEVIDLAAVEASIDEQIEIIETVEIIEPGATNGVEAPAIADLAARLAKLEDTVASVGKAATDLRAELQNMAIAADDRLAAIESRIGGAKGEQSDPK